MTFKSPFKLFCESMILLFILYMVVRYMMVCGESTSLMIH